MHQMGPCAFLGASYFVDLAANNATEASNTRLLERDFGWRGVCIEANPRYFWAGFLFWGALMNER